MCVGLNAEAPRSGQGTRRPYVSLIRSEKKPPRLHQDRVYQNFAKFRKFYGGALLETECEHSPGEIMRDRITPTCMGAELQAEYGKLGTFTYMRFHRLIADGRIPAVRDGRSVQIERRHL